MSATPRPGAAQGAVAEDRALTLLVEGELEVLGRVPWASNGTLITEVRHQGLAALAVYKPRRGERPLWDFPDGTLYRREVAAYLVSRYLGWDLVPPTVARDGPLGVGSLQLFVEADLTVTAFELIERGDPAMPRIAAFDVVANNADRKAGHCLLGADGRVWAIDHGLCFHAEPKLRTVVWDFAGQPLDEALATDLEALAGRVPDDLAGLLAPLLDPGEVQAIAGRAAGLLRAGVLPNPRGGRAYPWPLV